MLSPVIHGDSVHLGSVRCRSGRDAIRDRRLLEAAMGEVSGARAGLPARALLIVRRVAPAAPLRAFRRFADAVQHELARKFRVASRPWLEAGAASTEAVWFADEVELAACLIRDWLQGRVTERWWWKQVLGAATATEWWRRQVLRSGQTFAAVTEMLTVSGHVFDWFARLESAHVSQARLAIESAYGINDVESSALGASTPRAALKSAPADESNAKSLRVDSAALRALLEIAPEIASSALSVERQNLLATVLVVRRQLHWTRSATFPKALRALRERQIPVADREVAVADLPRRAVIPDPAAPDEMGTAHSCIGRTPPMQPNNGAGSLPTSVADPSNGSATSIITAKQPVRAEGLPREPSMEAPETKVKGSPCVQASMRPLPGGGDSSVPAMLEERARAAAASESTEVVAAQTRTQVVDSLQSAGVQTSFGGIFYLLNVALALGLYGDFTQPRHRGLDLSPWDWLAAIGWRWFGSRFRKDPIWKMLADLAGHPPRRRPERGFKPSRNVDQWFAEMSEQLIARLMQALGTDDPRQVPNRVCRHRAHIYKSASQVDVHLSLDGLPIELRVAGLDRDPGWIPAAGHTVRFHFE